MKITLYLQAVSIDADGQGFFAELLFGPDMRSDPIERIKLRTQAEAEAIFLAMDHTPEDGLSLSANLHGAVGHPLELTYIRQAPLPEAPK